LVRSTPLEPGIGQVNVLEPGAGQVVAGDVGHPTSLHQARSTVATGAALAPLCVKSVALRPVDGAPVLATVKQTALDRGCGAAL